MDASRDELKGQMLAMLPRLRRFALALTGRSVEADDLVQDTVERALRNLDRFEPGTRIDSWLYRIAQNLWIDKVRAAKVRGTMVDLDEAAAALFDGERAAETRTLLSNTLCALGELPEDQRAVVFLFLIEGGSYKEAADILKVPIGTVTSRLARAREALAQRVFGSDAAEDVLP